MIRSAHARPRGRLLPWSLCIVGVTMMTLIVTATFTLGGQGIGADAGGPVIGGSDGGANAGGPTSQGANARGCGCQIGGAPHAPAAPIVSLALMALVALARRRRTPR